MPTGMTHRERVRAAIDGRPWDRPPVSLWRHYFEREQSAETLAEAMLGHQNRYDWDFMKFNPRASYHAEPWGLKVRYTGNRTPDLVSAPVNDPKDWTRIEKLGLDNPVFQEQLRAIELVGQGLGGKIVYLATVFTPLSIASRLTPTEDMFMQHLREHTPQVDSAIEAITETFTAFAKAAIDRGAGGLFYATTAFATTDRMSVEEYRKYARPSDLKLIEAVPAPEFHMLHVCRDHNMLGEFRDYPVDVFNWDVNGPGNMGLAEGRAALGGKCVVGGVAQKEGLIGVTAPQIRGEVLGLRRAMGAHGWMVGSNCTYAPEVDEALIAEVRRTVDGL